MRIKGARSLPDIDKPILQDIFGLAGVVHHTKCHAVEDWRKTVIQHRESTLITIGDPLDQIDLVLLIVFLHCQPC